MSASRPDMKPAPQREEALFQAAAQPSGLDIDTRGDIYSLGVLLYELLAGSPPFNAKELMASGIDAMRKAIREREPVRLSTRVTRELVAASRQSAADYGGENGGALPRPR